jgi:hypothetical protein
MTDHESAVEIREAITAASERIETQVGLLVQVAERIAIALERLAEQQAPPA